MNNWQSTTVVLIPIPFLYNQDEVGSRQPIEDEKFVLTGEELALQFGGCSLYKKEKDPTKGFWWDGFIVHRDPLVVFEVHLAEAEESRDWLQTYAREVLLSRFQQQAIYITMIGPIQTLIVRQLEITR